MAPCATKLESEDSAFFLAQTVLESLECCHVARGVPLPNGSLGLGLGLRKWVMTCLSLSLNKVACGPKSTQGVVVPGFRQMYC